MDDNEVVSDVQRSDAVDSDIRPSALKLEDLKILKLQSQEQIQELLNRYGSMKIQKADPRIFLAYLMDTRSWFVEVGDLGLIYLTDIYPYIGAQLHFLFWDGKLSADRRELIKAVLGEAFDLFKLPRVSSVAIHTNVPLRKTLRKLGFTLEGTIRKGILIGEEYFDQILFGLLKEELGPCVRAEISSV